MDKVCKGSCLAGDVSKKLGRAWRNRERAGQSSGSAGRQKEQWEAFTAVTERWDRE